MKPFNHGERRKGTVSDEHGAIAFAEKVLAMLGEGRFTTTYKYAVMLGLIDLCLEGVTTNGRAPDSVTTVQLAEKVLRLYWPHTVGFDGDERVLRQSSVGRAEVLTLIVAFRSKQVRDPSASLSRARQVAPAAYANLLREVEWKLVEMPLPRVQQFGALDDPFIYQIGWDPSIRRKEFLDLHGFSNAIRFVGDASDHLVRLAGLLRPLLQRRWAADVARMNGDRIKDAALEDFLFGVDRIALKPVLDELRELQNGRCFYCAGPLKEPQVDHFIPWARVPLNAIENLVVADKSCNNGKKDHLVAAPHVRSWMARLASHASDLEAIAHKASWDQGSAQVLGVARATYLLLPSSARLWLSAKPSAQEFVAADPCDLKLALAG